MHVQNAIKKETARIGMATVIGTVIMCAVFFGLHTAFPEAVPFDYTVILGGAAGCAVAVANFFFMGLIVQAVTDAGGTQDQADRDRAFNTLKASYRNRTLAQLLWIIIAIVAPCFNPVSGIIPLFLPGILIKVLHLTGIIKV